MKNILFVCIENSNRSQMAEAFARILSDKVNAYSSGSKPSGVVNPKALAAMGELGYDLSRHRSKPLDEFKDMEFEYAITMGCGDECPFIQAKHHLDWNIPDPKHMEKEEFAKVRDLIRAKVEELLKANGW